MSVLARAVMIGRLRESFQQKYRIDASGCWLWMAAKQQTGYGYIHTHGLSKNSKPANVVSWLLHRDRSLDLDGQISVHHKCFVKSCVNPDHLVAMTAYEQMLHKKVTALGVLDKMEVEFPAASSEIAAVREKIKLLLGLTTLTELVES